MFKFRLKLVWFTKIYCGSLATQEIKIIKPMASIYPPRNIVPFSLKQLGVGYHYHLLSSIDPRTFSAKNFFKNIPQKIKINLIYKITDFRQEKKGLVTRNICCIFSLRYCLYTTSDILMI